MKKLISNLFTSKLFWLILAGFQAFFAVYDFQRGNFYWCALDATTCIFYLFCPKIFKD